MYEALLSVALSIKEIFEILAFRFVLVTDVGSMQKLEDTDYCFRSIALRIEVKSLLFVEKFE